MNDFCNAVGRLAEQYGVEDGADLCYNLIEQGVISVGMTHSHAAQIVAQHVLQA